LLGRSRVLDADDHAACLGLVENVWRDDLHHHREAHATSDLRGVRCRFRDIFLGNRNAVGVADDLAFRRRQARAFVRFHLIEDFADGIFIRHWAFLPKFYGIWYASNQVVKTSHCCQKPKKAARLTFWHLACQKSSATY